MFGNTEHDEGFSLVEVLFAIVIFFIGFMAVMTLMETNMMSSAKAKEKAALVNAAASYVEQVRQMPYGEITGLSPTTVETNGFKIVITPSITAFDDATTTETSDDYKELRLNLSAELSAKPGSMAMSYTTATIISRSGSGSSTNPLLPTIVFVDPSPAYGATVHDDQDVTVSAHANGEGVKLTTMSFTISEGNPLVSRSWTTAEFSSLESADIPTTTFLWDTLHLDTVGAVLKDGWHTLKVEVWDSNGQRAFIERRVWVANCAPEAPTTMTFQSTSPTALQVSWSPAIDGISPADHYVLSGGGLSAPVSVVGASTIVGVSPFHRYTFSVVAAERDRADMNSAACVDTVITAPRLTATDALTYTGNGSKKTLSSSRVSLHLALPSTNFAYTLNGVTIRKFAGSPSGAMSEIPIGTATDWTDSLNSSLARYYYQVVLDLTVDGNRVTVCSNLVGPSAQSGVTTIPEVWPVPCE